MINVGLIVLLEARPGKEEELAGFLAGALPLAQAEAGTAVWYALRSGKTSFAIVDAFPDEAGRAAHLDGPIARALLARAGELLAAPPDIRKVEVLAAKALPPVRSSAAPGR
ncbi:MAG TPA: antibiotic biosynthesis monooxygenase [Kofleriaceae bacterium]|nr:antibiotic biosynthesis monooxygenase [Kofleriaceae bacterium]